MAILTVGNDAAKNVFAMHGVDEQGRVELRNAKVTRAKLNALIAALPPRNIGIEACSGSHHWTRLFEAHGHTVRLLTPKLVSPYRLSGKQGKNDAADAAAICEAVRLTNFRRKSSHARHRQFRSGCTADRRPLHHALSHDRQAQQERRR